MYFVIVKEIKYNWNLDISFIRKIFVKSIWLNLNIKLNLAAIKTHFSVNYPKGF